MTSLALKFVIRRRLAESIRGLAALTRIRACSVPGRPLKNVLKPEKFLESTEHLVVDDAQGQVAFELT